MVHSITNTVKPEITPSSSYRILNPSALDKRVGHCAEKTLGQNVLQGCGACDDSCDNSCDVCRDDRCDNCDARCDSACDTCEHCDFSGNTL